MKIWNSFMCKANPGESHDEPLKHKDFPALFRAADTHSIEQQNVFYKILFVELLLLVTATTISMFNFTLPLMAIVQALILFGALGCAVYLFSAKPDRHWYSARAVAESVKTVTWRYVTRVEPFFISDTEARTHFSSILSEIVKQNRDVAKRFSTDLDEMQITPRMESLRQSSFPDRKSAYIEGRVVEQQNWYARKNKVNDCLAKRSFILLVCFISLAAIAAVCKIRFSQAAVWPTDVFVSLASVIVSWSQAKRYSELAASYSLAAHEISLVRVQAELIADDLALSKFIGDAENAFSREHTQWIARRDV